MTTENTPEVPEEKLIVTEAQDGTVTVAGLPETEAEAQEEAAPAEKEPQEAAEGGPVTSDEDADHEDDTEAIRAAKREKRRLKKQYHRELQKEKDLKYQQLVRQNQELLTRLSAVEQKTHGSELARIDKAIEDQELRIQYAKMKIAEAATANDGEAMANAQEMWFEARRAAEALANLKKQAAQPKQQAIVPDRDVQKNAAQWMERTPWYDPNKRDRDSKIATVIDEELSAEGWDPRLAEYWEELDERLQKALPHRYGRGIESPSAGDREVVKRPRSAVTGSGRESAPSSGGKGTFTLTREQVNAMKDAGMWDDPAARARMIKRYQAEAQANRNRS